MTKIPLPTVRSGRLISRSRLLVLLETAKAVGSQRFARQAALSWLAYYPGDLPITLSYAKTLVQSGLNRQALPVLEKLCRADPEYLEAQSFLVQARLAVGLDPEEADNPCVFVLGEQYNPSDSIPAWAFHLRRARQALANGDLPRAEESIHQVLSENSSHPLIAITHLAISQRINLPNMTMRKLADLYHQRWPDCLSCTLRLAETQIYDGQFEEAVALLHQAAAGDVTGQVAERIWGTQHPYRNLWPERMEAPLELAIPAPIAAALGWNRLNEGESPPPISPVEETQEIKSAPVLYPQETPSIQESTPDPQPRAKEGSSPQEPRPAPSYPDTPETLRSVQEELERVAARLKQDYLTKTDGRFPVYVILTSRKGLKAHYGNQFEFVDESLKHLAAAIDSRPDWGAVLLYADDPASADEHSLQPAQPGDPWSLKLALVDLDAALARKGEMIGAVLIVGGPEVVPFHHLPNPVDDADVDTPSDNPYATRDENYFIPEWPVGRLPGGAQFSAEPLIKIIRSIADRHMQIAQSQPWSQRWWCHFRAWFRERIHQVRPSWGYTAAIWRRASLSVFRPIGQPHALVVSPPAAVDNPTNGNRRTEVFPSAKLAYFNLHGLKEASEWFGQRDPSEPSNDPDYPVALRPQDVINSGRAPQVVFSEACFGAYIQNRSVQEALALKFLTSGSQVVVGSTCTAYGSITPPLIAADLLGHTFWKYLREGLPAGEALRRAKIHLAREMLRRQGYLDGEDQKTLISFVLFGDPLTQPSDVTLRTKTVYRPLRRPAAIKTVCDRVSSQEQDQASIPPLPAGILAQVKHVVEQYLPGMQDAHLTYAPERANCQGEGHTCPTSQLGRKGRPTPPPSRRVVTLSKQITQPDTMGSSSAPEHPVLIHQHYVRLTIDEQGQVVKLAISR